jgi:hypothetical protein
MIDPGRFGQQKNGPRTRRGPFSVSAELLQSLADDAEDALDGAAQEEQSQNSRNGDECEDQSVFRETLCLLGTDEHRMTS